jgi:hypothetical protein
MLSFLAAIKVYLCTVPCDMRRSFDGLSMMAEHVIRCNPFSGATVPSENFVWPTSHAISRGEPQSRRCLQSSLSLANEIRRGTGVQGSTVRTLISEPQGEAARSLVDSGFSGSPSFVAVMQSTDLWHRHD